MPSDRLEDTAAIIDALLEDRRTKRNAMIDATAGCLAGPVGDALVEAMAECEIVHQSMSSLTLDSSIIIRHRRSADPAIASRLKAASGDHSQHVSTV